MDNTPLVVNPEESTTPPEEATPAEPQPGEVTPGEVTPPSTPAPAPNPGDKTDSALLLDSLQKERDKRRDLEEEIEKLQLKLESPPQSDEVYSDEGKVLEGKILELQTQLSGLAKASAKKDVLLTHPILKEKWAEFEEFRSAPENKGMNLKTAAKAYLVENELYEPPRKGLEKPTGGPKTPITSGMTASDVEHLRKTDYRKYRELTKKGLINVTK